MHIIEKRTKEETSENLFIKPYSTSGEQLGRSFPLKPTKVTLFTMILYNSETNVGAIRPFCHPLFCHSSVVKYTEPVLRLDYHMIMK